MPWVKIDDNFFRHPKVIAAGRDARDLFLSALCYCASGLTDGRVPPRALRILGADAEIEDPNAAAERLVECGLWERGDDGYVVHDWEMCGIVVGSAVQDQRRTPAYEGWRTAVLERDGYACTTCGAVDDPLHAHHIQPFALFPERRLAIDNGKTLCQACHRAVHCKRER